MDTKKTISQVEFMDFAQFGHITIPFSNHINVISGETGVGKTNVLKALYSYGKSMNDVADIPDHVSTEKFSELLASKLLGVFRPDNRKIGRLVKRDRGRGKSICKITYSDQHELSFSFSTAAIKNIKTEGYNPSDVFPKFVYIPAKEIISATENFIGLYEKYHIAFDETYYDLSKLLLLPTRKGPQSKNQKSLIQSLEGVIEGKVVAENQKFYLKTQGIGKIEMAMVAEGFRKISTLLQLISNEGLSENTVLFWDEPEANINPKMIPALKNMLVALAQMGVQIFITTHSYFLLQELSLYAQYENNNQLDIRFITLYEDKREDGTDITFESQHLISELEHNPIQQEFIDLYNREQEMFYDDTSDRK